MTSSNRAQKRKADSMSHEVDRVVTERPSSSRVKNEGAQQMTGHLADDVGALPMESTGASSHRKGPVTIEDARQNARGKAATGESEMNPKQVTEDPTIVVVGKRIFQALQSLARIETKVEYNGEQLARLATAQRVKQGSLKDSSESFPQQASQVEDDRSGSRDLGSAQSEHSTPRDERNALERQLQVEIAFRQDLEARHRKSVKSAQDGLHRLQEQNRNLTKELEACKAELCRMKPSEPLTDLDVIKQYQALSHSVSDWVSTIFDRLDEATDQSNNIMSRLVMTCCDAYTDALCAQVESASEFVMYGSVMHILQTCIFQERRYLPGLSQEAQQAFEDVEAGMEILTGTKEVETFQEWKSDTLKALSSLPAYQKRFNDRRHEVTEIMAKHLQSDFLGLEGLDSLHEELLDAIVRPAMKLDHMMRLSRRCYKFDELSQRCGNFTAKELEELPIEGFRFLDLESRKAVEDITRVRADAKGIKAFGYAFLEPGLLRAAKTSNRVKRLTDTSAVLHLACQLPKKTKPGSGKSRHNVEDSAVS